MKVFYTEGSFEYYHPIYKKMILTKNKVPFIIDNKGKLVIEVNKYLLLKTELDWNHGSSTPQVNAESILIYLRFCIDYNIAWQESTSVDVNKYVLYLSKKVFKENTVKNRVIHLQNLFLWLEDNSYIKYNPFWDFNTRQIKRKINAFLNKDKYKNFDVSSVKSKVIKSVTKEDIPSKESVLAMYEQLDEQTKLTTLMLMGTGMRKNEALQLTVEMFKGMRDNGEGRSYSLFLDASLIQIKGNKSRYVTVSSTLRTKVLKYLRSQDYKEKLSKYLSKNKIKKENALILISRQGNKSSENKLNYNFESAMSKSNFDFNSINAITPHQLRHYYASSFIASKDKQGDCLEDAYMYLAERLGHSSPDITKKYYVKIINKMKQEKELEKFSEDILAGFLS